MDTLSAFLRAQPEFRFTWAEATLHGAAAAACGKAGLYAVYKGSTLIYLGQSGDLGRRIGQFIGAACTGATGLHSGGCSAYHGWQRLPPGETVFEAYVGLGSQERQLIRKFDPVLNGGLRRTSSAPRPGAASD